MSDRTVLTPDPEHRGDDPDAFFVSDDLGADRGPSLTGDEGANVDPGGAAGAAEAFGTVSASGQWRDIRRRFVRNKLAVVGLGMIVLLVFVAIFAPLIAPYGPKHQDLFNTESPPSAKHWFGTDVVGRDQFTRVLYGTRIALLVGLSSIVLASLIGVILGSIAGYFGRFWDSLIMRIADIFFAFPLLVGAIVIITVAGQGVAPVIIALAVFGWATVARLLRSSILSVREADYVEAARSLGASRLRIVRRHILPNSFAPVLVFATFSVGTAIVSEAALSYLGVGVPPDVAEWGNMIAAGQAKFNTSPWLSLLPSAAVVFTVLAFVFVGDGLRDALDPKLK